MDHYVFWSIPNLFGMTLSDVETLVIMFKPNRAYSFKLYDLPK